MSNPTGYPCHIECSFFKGGIELLQIPHRPFAPHVKLQSASEIRVSWLPVLVSNKQAVRYELFSGDDLEYVGYDLVYVAKRLKPGTEYKFKVRACSLTGCSDFSLTRLCQTSINGNAAAIVFVFTRQT